MLTLFNKYKLNLLANPLTDSIGVLEHTDLFTWAVFKDNATRLLRISKSTGKLIYCEFTSGLVTMKAYLVY